MGSDAEVDEITGRTVIGCVILRGSRYATDELGEEVRRHVATKLGPIARPKTVVLVPDLPKTRSGKNTRRLLRDVAEGRSLGDTTTTTSTTTAKRRLARVPLEEVTAVASRRLGGDRPPPPRHGQRRLVRRGPRSGRSRR